jgi:hypothetical protein
MLVLAIVLVLVPVIDIPLHHRAFGSSLKSRK